MSNETRFREVYTDKLSEAITRNPKDYFYTVDGVSRVVEKMLVAVKRGSAAASPALTATARALNVTGGLKGLRAFLNEGA